MSIKHIAADVEQVGVELYDLTGKQVQSRMLPAVEGQINTSLELGDLRSGVYLMRVTAGDHSTTERIVIQR